MNATLTTPANCDWSHHVNRLLGGACPCDGVRSEVDEELQALYDSGAEEEAIERAIQKLGLDIEL